jgi:DNA-binding transcriptional MerR regulator
VIEITIDELARRVAMTPRNVRAHQTRGLLPAPELRGRVAYYNQHHIERLNTISQLQSAGLTLEEIAELLERMPSGRAEELLALARATAAPFSPEPPVIVTAAALWDYWGEQATPELLERMNRLGHVRRLDNGDYEVRSARLVRGATELARLGVPLEAALDLIEAIWVHQTAVADEFATFFIRHVAASDAIPADPGELDATINRLRRLAGESVLAVFGMALEQSLRTTVQSNIAESP